MKRKVLIVYCSELMRMIFTLNLAPIAEVVFASSSTDAVEFLQSGAVDALILDGVGMPELSLKFIERMRFMGIRCPVVAVSRNPRYIRKFAALQARIAYSRSEVNSALLD